MQGAWPSTKLALLILPALVALSCGRSGAPIVAPAGAKAGDLALSPGTIKSDFGPLQVNRGTLVVPENRARPGSRLIALPLVRLRAKTPAPAEPVFFLGGGPGSSNIHSKIPAWVSGLLDKRDFVMVGYRGTDGSVVLDCPEVAQALKGTGGDLLGAESRARLAEAMAAAARRLRSEGVDLEGYTVPEVAEDLDVARSALGYERVNLLSMSYGTRVAQVYAFLHADRLSRSAMVGANPPGHFVWDPGMIDAQLAQYARLCARDSSCSARTPDLAETMRRVAHRMPRRWWFIRIDPGKVKVATFALLYHRRTAAMAFDAYLAADRSDPSGLALMSLVSDFILPKTGIWGDLLCKGSIDYDAARDYATELNPPDSILGSPMSQLIWGPIGESKPWPIPRIPEKLRRLQPSAVATLLVSGSVDFSTPAEAAAKELLPALSRGRQVTLAEMGHCNDLMFLQPKAFERLLTSFYDTGTADESLFTYAPMDFRVSWGFPALAKLMLGAGALLVVLVGALIWLFVRRLKRRRLVRVEQA